MDAAEDAGARATPHDARRAQRLRRLTLAVALVPIAAGVVATLSHAKVRRLGTNGVPARQVFATAPGGGSTICQSGETIPNGTSALRIALIASSNETPRLVLTVTRGDAVVAKSTAARWEGSRTVVVPLTPTVHGSSPAGVCLRLVAGGPQLYGLPGTPFYPEEGATLNGRHLSGRLHVEYLAAGTRSWWSFVPTLVRRIGRGHAWSGPTVALLVALLMLTPIVLTVWQLRRPAR